MDVLHHYVRSKLLRMTQRIDDAATRTRYLIVLHADRSVPRRRSRGRWDVCDRPWTASSIATTNWARRDLLTVRDNGSAAADKLYVSKLKWILESSRGFFVIVVRPGRISF